MAVGATGIVQRRQVLGVLAIDAGASRTQHAQNVEVPLAGRAFAFLLATGLPRQLGRVVAAVGGRVDRGHSAVGALVVDVDVLADQGLDLVGIANEYCLH